MDIKKVHNMMLKKLRTIISQEIYIDCKAQWKVKCTMEDVKNNDIIDKIEVGMKSVVFKVLIDDLKEVNAPIKNIKKILHNRETYEVIKEELNDTFSDCLKLTCKVFVNGEKK